jgi:hypothetical protein
MYMEPFLNYLGAEWNRTHPAPEEQITTIELYYLHQLNMPNHTKTPVKQDLLWSVTWD